MIARSVGRRLCRVTVEIGWQLGAALTALVLLGVVANIIGRIGVQRSVAWAAVRAIVQLAAVSLILAAALSHVATAIAFVCVMFGIAVYTTGKRTDVLRSGGWRWSALAMASGALPVLAVVFGFGVAPLNGPGIVPIASIIVGNMMTAHTLFGRRAFADLRNNIPTYEAALSIGLLRSDAIAMVTQPNLREALVPALDQTRTVGLVTLPGAFIGVLLGGGSPLQAGAAQVLVLVGVLAGQSLTIAVAERFARQGRLLPADLKARLRP